MPTRLVREGIINSDRVDALDFPAEVFYRRLLNKVDDHGLFDARLSVLRTSLFPLRVDRVQESDCAAWLEACRGAGLLVVYEVDGKRYLKVLDTRWQERSEPKYPKPSEASLENARKQLETGANTRTVVVVEGVVVDDKTIVGLKSQPDPVNGMKKEFARQAVEIIGFLNGKAGKHFTTAKQNVDLIVALLAGGVPADDIRAVVAKKCREWKGKPEMETYLRPATLFGPKNFHAKYHGEIPPIEVSP